MNQSEFLAGLRARLSELPQREVEERLAFYAEIINDRMEEGISETEAVRELGSLDRIATQIIAEIPFVKIAKEKIKPKRRLGAWEIVLLVLGSPIWLSLLIAAFAVILSLYVVIWSVVISLWSVFVALIASGVGIIVASAIFALIGHGLVGGALIGAGLVCVGLSVFVFFGCHAASKAMLLLTKKLALGMKYCLIGKERG